MQLFPVWPLPARLIIMQIHYHLQITTYKPDMQKFSEQRTIAAFNTVFASAYLMIDAKHPHRENRLIHMY